MGVTLTWREPPERNNRSYGSRVTFGGVRDRGTGYMEYSDRVGPGVIVVHDAFGIGPGVVTVADDLNRNGFTVLCPDLHGSPEARARTQLEAAAHHLTDNWHPRLGIIGFSVGAGLAAGLAGEVESSALVLYYGLGPTGLQIPVQGHFGAGDEEVPVAAATAAFEGLVDSEMHVYEDVGHGFANPETAAYDEASAGLAMLRTRDFLQYNLS
jgi:carboxymethylenebutenolidase